MDMHRLGWITLISLLGGCHPSQAVPARAPKNELRFQCSGPRNLQPPLKLYSCAIDVLDVAAHDRWLIMPFLMEDPLRASHKVVLLQLDEKAGQVAYCSARDADDAFDAILIPAHQRLHIGDWELKTFQDRVNMSVWRGAVPPLSSGETLGAIFQRLVNEKAGAPEGSYWPPSWRAPPGTTMEFAPDGFFPIDIRPLSPWGMR